MNKDFKVKINPPLKSGDRIALIYMDDKHPLFYGEKGTVVSDMDYIFSDNKNPIWVKWDNGRSLSLIDGEDKWCFEEDFDLISKKRNVKESIDHQNEFFMSNINLIKNFDTKLITKYLIIVRKTGLVNMLAAAPFLWQGRERIEHEYKYKDISDEDTFEKVLDMANKVQSNMITGVIKILESENKELTVESINRALLKYSQKLIMWYVNVLS